MLSEKGAMISAIFLALGGVLEIAALALFLTDSLPAVLVLVVHGAAALTVRQALLEQTAEAGWSGLAASITFLFPLAGYLVALGLFLSAGALEDSISSLAAEFRDYVSFKGHWGERQRYDKDLRRTFLLRHRSQPLMDLVIDDDPAARRTGIRLAGRLGGSAGVAALSFLAGETDLVLRHSAAREMDELEERWMVQVNAVRDECRRHPDDPEPCLRLGKLLADAADQLILGPAFAGHLRRQAIGSLHECRRRGGDAETALLAEARLLIRNGQAGEALKLLEDSAEFILHDKTGAALLAAEAAAAAGDPRRLRLQVERLGSLPRTTESERFLGFLGEL